MIIHVVQPGETIVSISEYYHIPVDRLIIENGITNPDNLAIGQTIVIVQPETVYTVRAGDTLQSIAKQYSVTVMDLLRNNPTLSDRNYLNPGETIVITYQTKKTRTIATNGYTFSYIDKAVLKKTLPYLTYLSIFNYTATDKGEIIPAGDDTELVQMALSYGVAPIMFVSTITQDGKINRRTNYNILNDSLIQDLLIENSLQILKNKGYYGINIYIEEISFHNLDKLSAYLKKASDIFHPEGYQIFITITPVTNINTSGISLEELNYTELFQYVDKIIFASYDWATTFGYPSSIFPVNILINLLNYAVSNIPSEDILLGFTTVGYDWELPYIPGVTGANIISNDGAIQIAAINNIPIQFNETAQSPYFYYMDSDGILHVIWFNDARSFQAQTMLVTQYNLLGLSLWTIMKFNAQMWFIINTQYNIQKL
ncbi:LysM peptidoglycan-binding domain-containing protein [Clostridium boliviensis]|uniref:LysM peptidoglycan-binding domain-containing protein n=1 Tax=Clostridium boliviensis TaxID=318465 RepID=A0ABU4GGR4_9CLOT|nr:LysM peptidoglycan-binding domain-containing protein [Clostridium boliviensis]MDW2796817.1 LysM peptidoglycan-binding domain-containing protein [Clostridium boliviensis]